MYTKPRYAVHTCSLYLRCASNPILRIAKHHNRLNPALAFPFALPAPSDPGAEAFLGAGAAALLTIFAVVWGLSGSLSGRSADRFSFDSSEQMRLAGRVPSSLALSSAGRAAKPVGLAS